MKEKLLYILFVFSITFLQSQNFTEVSNMVGIDHIFNQSSEMGGGAVFFDYNNDGWEDLYITSGLGKDHFYINTGNGNFIKSNSAWLDITSNYYTTGVASGDFNNDGFRDLLVTTWREDNNGVMSGPFQRNLLFLNEGNGNFSENGLDFNLTEASFAMGVNVLDVNNDGLLDIYIINYLENSIPLYDNNGEVNGFDHDCYKNTLYLNNGNNTFSNVSVSAGVDNDGCALASMPTDFDQDNDQDIYIANDFGEFVSPNAILENNSGVFTDISVTTNMNIGIYGMGISYADYDKDLDFDYYITNLGRNVLLDNNGSQVFSDKTTEANIENTYSENSSNTLFSTSWGTAFIDVNNNTWPDLFVANGRVPAADFIATGEDDPNKLFLNNGDGTFNDVSNTAGVNDYSRGRGLAYSDYDKDGDVDVLVVVQDESQSSNSRTTLYQNQLNPNGNENANWVQVQLTGTSINKDAIGAKVQVKANGETLIQEVHGQGSHCSQHSLVLHFGLASANEIEEIKVIWSNTYTQTFSENLDINKRYNITEGESLSLGENQKDSFVFYPNPVIKSITFSNLEETLKVKVYDLLGKLILTSEVSKTIPYLNIEKLSSGTYLFDFINKNNPLIKRQELIIKE